MTLVRLILLLGICVTGFVTIECVDCSNEAGYCYFYTSSLDCYITANDTQSITALLRDCSNNSASLIHLSVFKNYVSNEYGNLLIDIELPTNIQSLYIDNLQDHDYMRLTTSSQNTGLTRIYTYSHIKLESITFFTHFTGLGYIYMRYVISREPPSFTNLLSLTYLGVRIVGPVTHALDEGIVSGLTNLVYLYISNSYFNGITKGAFRNLNKLRRLHLNYIKLAYIEDGALTELSSLREFLLYNNEEPIVSDNIFQGLTDLTYLYLNNNPGFPLNALMQAKSVIYLYLQDNGYHTLDPYVFQQMDSLRYLILSDPFQCDCALQWTSLVEQYQLHIYSAFCSGLLDPSSSSITNTTLYTDCAQTESFQCFNKSITCPDYQICHNTEDSYSCGCPRGYALYNSGQCKDVNECDETTDCQYTCQNTEGSFHCTCAEGYELSSDGYSCEDIDECQVSNGGCEFGCRNTVGSYQCLCYYGHKLTNKTHCDNEIQYIVIQGIETEDYQFDCYGDYNLTITNFTCENIPPISATTTMLTTAMTTNVITPTTTTTTTTAPSGCPIGYVQRYSGECVDEDECDFYTNCQHSCVNTEGSFHCDCYEGYELADDQSNCTDINECHQLNGGCEFGCSNTIGSYQCYCYYGLELTNNTHCKDEIQCDIQQNNAGQGNHFTCEGIKLTIDNSTCINSFDQTIIQNTENPSSAVSIEQNPVSTIIMFSILILIIGVQTVIIILVLLCSIRMRKAVRNPKTHRNMRQAHFQDNVGIPLEDIIERQHNMPPSMIMQNPDNTEVIFMHENMD